MNTAYFALGSNLGDKSKNLQQALILMQSHIGDITAVSRFQQTKALLPEDDKTPQPDYLNAACRLLTGLAPRQILMAIERIESELGRERQAGKRWASRTIDIDLLAYDDVVIDDPDLKVPHPELHKRNFVLDPLVEIAAGWVHPLFKISAQSMAEKL